MTLLYPDTPPKVEALQIELIRQMPMWKKMAMVESLNDTVKTLALSEIRRQHPEASPEQIRRLLAEAILGAEMAKRVYGRAG